MYPVPRFSFNYNGRPFDVADAKVIATDRGFFYEAGDGLGVELCIQRFPEYNAIKWMLWFENRGDKDSGLISDVCDCDATWCFTEAGRGCGGKLTVTDTTGNTSYESYLRDEDCAGEFSTHERTIPLHASMSYHPLGGRSASGTMPFFDFYTEGEDDRAKGLIAAVGWSGQWKATFSHLDGGTLGIKTGLEFTSFVLRPGERIRTSSIIFLEYEGKRTAGTNAFRRLIKNEICPFAPEQYPFALEGMGIPTEKHLFHIENFKKHGVKADYYWIDAGWYGKGAEPGAADWYKQVGNWQVRPDEHPDGLLDVVAAAKDAGMKFLLWMEPERAYPGTDLALEHPDWLYPIDGFCLLLRLEKDEVREYLFDLICGFIDRLEIRCLRLDFNMEPLRSWRLTDEADRCAINEIKYIMNLYRLWDDLRARYPDLVIDNCASGGRRIDVEALSRTFPVWRTDAYCEWTRDPDVIQTQAFGFNRLIPTSGGVCKKLGDTYATRSAYAPAYVGSWWWTDRPTPTEEQFAWMAKMCDEYRMLRPYFSCDFYPLENPGWSADHGGWAAFRYDRPEEGDGIVMVFRRSGSGCETSRYVLEGIDSSLTYSVEDIDTGEITNVSGKGLTEEGLLVRIEGRYESRVLRYKSLRECR
ncbi:MAG: alpha-galactosidase [Clostridia bacterium]|nr:alpha-galactosidase [Clostridia bacterium]